jgi:signal peptide peptidase SppA
MQNTVKADTTSWTGLHAMERVALRNLIAQGKSAKPDPSKPAKPATPDTNYAVNGNVAIIPIVGPVTKYTGLLSDCDVSTLAVQAAITEAINDNDVDSIVLYIDSPGGTVAGTSDLASHIRQSKAIKPITAYVSDHCFSAAYWIASQCSQIVANEGAFVGSIGVYSVLLDSSKAAEQAGFAVTLVSAGEYKGLEEDGVPIGDKAIEETQRQVDAAYELFINSVAVGRNLSTNTVKQLADGRIHVAAEAIEMKLIDAIGTLDVAINKGLHPMANEKKAADAPADQATPAPDDVLKQILASLTAISTKLDALTSEEQDEESTEGQPDKADDADDDADASKKVATAVASDRDRLKAISEAVGHRADFAIAQHLAGATATEAKAALADILKAENETLRKQIAGAEGSDPLALKGAGDKSVASDNVTDHEATWANNVGGVQQTFLGKKEKFLAVAKWDAAHKNKKRGN